MTESINPPRGEGLSSNIPLIPVRILNEFVYCPRLAYLEWVQGEFEDSADTVQGRFRHRRVEKEGGKLPDSGDFAGLICARSVYLTAEKEGLTAKIDLVEGEGNVVSPVDYKRGKRPHVDKDAYEPERVQSCAQGLILRENGYACDKGVLYFTESKERVVVQFDEELIENTRQYARDLRLIAERGEIPPPLTDSPKCPRCSLAGICLPDELAYLVKGQPITRMVLPKREDGRPMYVQSQGAYIRKKDDELEVSLNDEVLATARIGEISQLVLFGSIGITTPLIHELCRREIPITYLSYGGWFLGHTIGIGHKNVELRSAQYARASETGFCLKISRDFVKAKILNCRTLLRRNHTSVSEELLNELKFFAQQAEMAKSMEELLGIEGISAQRYFGLFAGMFKAQEEEFEHFEEAGRNRRPPKDPVNALLSFAYSMLVREWTVAISAVGLDPYKGFYHQPRYGRPALALDLMEEFRPLIADSVVITVINNAEIQGDDFVSRMGASNLTSSGRSKFIAAFERRMEQETTHQIFGYKISYRQMMEVQARLLGRYLLGEISYYPSVITR
jgi:CRISPR-associated endonuclease Cas1/CRISPR-associated protein Cas4